MEGEEETDNIHPFIELRFDEGKENTVDQSTAVRRRLRQILSAGSDKTANSYTTSTRTMWRPSSTATAGWNSAT